MKPMHSNIHVLITDLNFHLHVVYAQKVRPNDQIFRLDVYNIFCTASHNFDRCDFRIVVSAIANVHLAHTLTKNGTNKKKCTHHQPAFLLLHLIFSMSNANLISQYDV